MTVTDTEDALLTVIDGLVEKINALERDRDEWKARAEVALGNARPLPHFMDVTYTTGDE